MVTSTQYNALSQGSNFAEWVVIINSWTNGIMFTALTIGTILILYASIKSRGYDNNTALITSLFAGTLISSIGAFITYAGNTLVPVWVPVMCSILMGIILAYTVISQR